jgi:polysaccharide pyruvyl transferase WcaK-like protein
MPSDKSLRIGLLGPFGYGNLGDSASLEAMIQNIRVRLPNAQIFGFSLNPEDTEQRNGIPSYPISRMSWKETGGSGLGQRLADWLGRQRNPALRALQRWSVRAPMEIKLVAAAYRQVKGLDLLIISGSGQLQDYWAGGGPWSFPYTLLKYALMTKLLRVDLMFVSVGAGPVNARLSRVFLRWALSLASYRSFRDDFSRKYVAEVVGFSTGDPVYPDLAFSLKSRAGEPRPRPTQRPIVGLGPIGYFRDGCWPEHDAARYADYLAKLAAFVTWLIRREYAVVFLPGEAHYDRLVIDELIQRLHADGLEAAADQIINVDIQTAGELMDVLTITDVVCACRYHNLVLAEILGRPVMAISYQAKIDALLDDSGQGAYCLPIASFRLEDLQNRFEALEENRPQSLQQIASRIQVYRAALEEQYARIFDAR